MTTTKWVSQILKHIRKSGDSWEETLKERLYEDRREWELFVYWSTQFLFNQKLRQEEGGGGGFL
jgi:hypothetical protein